MRQIGIGNSSRSYLASDYFILFSSCPKEVMHLMIPNDHKSLEVASASLKFKRTGFYL